MANQTTGLTRIIKATGYSLKGLRAAWKSAVAFRERISIRLQIDNLKDIHISNNAKTARKLL